MCMQIYRHFILFRDLAAEGAGKYARAIAPPLVLRRVHGQQRQGTQPTTPVLSGCFASHEGIHDILLPLLNCRQ